MRVFPLESVSDAMKIDKSLDRLLQNRGKYLIENWLMSFHMFSESFIKGSIIVTRDYVDNLVVLHYWMMFDSTWMWHISNNEWFKFDYFYLISNQTDDLNFF